MSILRPLLAGGAGAAAVHTYNTGMETGTALDSVLRSIRSAGSSPEQQRLQDQIQQLQNALVKSFDRQGTVTVIQADSKRAGCGATTAAACMAMHAAGPRPCLACCSR